MLQIHNKVAFVWHIYLSACTVCICIYVFLYTNMFVHLGICIWCMCNVCTHCVKCSEQGFTMLVFHKTSPCIAVSFKTEDNALQLQILKNYTCLFFFFKSKIIRKWSSEWKSSTQLVKSFNKIHVLWWTISIFCFHAFFRKRDNGNSRYSQERSRKAEKKRKEKEKEVVYKL